MKTYDDIGTKMDYRFDWRNEYTGHRRYNRMFWLHLMLNNDLLIYAQWCYRYIEHSMQLITLTDMPKDNLKQNVPIIDMPSRNPPSKYFKGFAVNVGSDKITFKRNFSPVGTKSQKLSRSQTFVAPLRRSPTVLPVKFSKLMLVEWHNKPGKLRRLDRR